MLLHQFKAEQRLVWRSRELAFFTFLLPIVFFLILGSAYGDEEIDGADGYLYPGSVHIEHLDAAIATDPGVSAAVAVARITLPPRESIVIGGTKGPVLVRLTCGCLGCDKELPYFQALHEAYKAQGLVSLAVFKEADAKVETYVKEKNLEMLYAVDTQGASWDVWRTKTMPSNFLIEKGGKIAAISTGCDPSGLIAARLSEKAAGLTGSKTVDVKSKVAANKPAQNTPKN